jgi:hypothetical protein
MVVDLGHARSGSFAMLAAIRRASSFVSDLFDGRAFGFLITIL